MTESTTLMGREEDSGKRYPLWIERLLLLGAVAVFFTYVSDVFAAIEQPTLAVVGAYVVFPLVLLAVVELCGRMLQNLHAS